MSGPRIAIVGTGANGASMGADMVNAGLDVTFIEQWPAHVEAMRTHGLTVHGPEGTTRTPVPVHHLCEVAEMRTPFDLVFLSVKSYDTRWATELIKPLVAPDGAVVGLQNGMTVDDVADVVGADRTLGAVLGIAANMYEPGVVVRQVPPSRTWLAVGSLDGARTPLVEEAARVLRHCGRVEVPDDIRVAKWMKLLANIPEMLPSAILDLPLLAAAGTPGVREVMDAMTREAYRVATALGVPMAPIFGRSAEDVTQDVAYAVGLLDSVLSGYSLEDTRVAVLQDWDKGRRGELDAFSGYVVARQRELGGSAPVNEEVLRLAQRIESGELRPGVENVALLRAALDASRGARSVTD